MPIYAYRCDSCGVEKDVLQKLSDAPLSVCPDCGAESFHKRLSAPAFQLKGSGWYVTDFRDGAKKDKDKDKAAAGDDKAAAPAADAKKEAPAASVPAPAPASPPAAAAASKPAPGAGGKTG
jgi:putative FmdB family regulatory protein